MPHQQSGGILHTVSAARRTVSDHSETRDVLMFSSIVNFVVHKCRR